MPQLTLKEALASDRLDDFIQQEEDRGVESVNVRELLAAIETTIKAPRSEDQTSHSASGDGSSGK